MFGSAYLFCVVFGTRPLLCSIFPRAFDIHTGDSRWLVSSSESDLNTAAPRFVPITVPESVKPFPSAIHVCISCELSFSDCVR